VVGSGAGGQVGVGTGGESTGGGVIGTTGVLSIAGVIWGGISATD
jgi:hypothetical protein